ncbi:hypothetical protein CDN99_24470 [Roseateles aquatilis]|uniref:Uncharacterized protein n=1 Tax=Roseateles aquatilis TaxID=431061 RepID=A0A246IWL5_9BURK|nr:hypothetical protein [Roseateles aquatilis]OWQ84447.1 hypothetical protein CDN99_24470 [Roseateles aquatilis]
MTIEKTVQRFARAVALMPLLAATGSAWADWVPQVQNRFYTATVRVNGGAASFNEPRSAYGPLSTISGYALGVPVYIQSGINDAIRPELQKNGVELLSGTVSGDLQVVLTPVSSGVGRVEIGGLDYRAVSSFRGSFGGIVRYDCQNVLTMTNTRIVGQIGSVGSGVTPGSVGMTTTSNSSTWCDSNLSWLLPVVGDLIADKITGKIDAKIEAGIATSVSKLDSALFVVASGNNFRSGLHQLVPRESVVRLPNGQDFRIGDYVWNNFDYIVANSQMTLKLGQAAPVDVVRGMQLPYGNVVTGIPLRMDVNVPGLSFSIELKDEAWVDWRWVCNVTRPGEGCEEP